MLTKNKIKKLEKQIREMQYNQPKSFLTMKQITMIIKRNKKSKFLKKFKKCKNANLKNQMAKNVRLGQ